MFYFVGRFKLGAGLVSYCDSRPWRNLFVTLIYHCVLGAIGCDSPFLGKVRCSADAREFISSVLCGRI